MDRSGHITSFAIDVTTLEPYKSCGQLANKAQGSALGSLVPNLLFTNKNRLSYHRD